MEAGAVLTAARSQLGVPYTYGGGGPAGPGPGIGPDRGTPGFDCSSLMQFAFRQGAGVALPRTADAQARGGRAVDPKDLRPGDVIAFARPGARSHHHIGLYLGGGKMLHAPRTGDVVRVVTVIDSPPWQRLRWSVRRYL